MLAKKYQNYWDKIFAKDWNYLSNQLVLQWKVALFKNALNASKLDIWRRWWFGNMQCNVASLKKALIASKLDIWRRLKLFVKSSDIDSRHTYWSGEMVSTIIIIDNFPFQHHKCPLIMIIVAEKIEFKANHLNYHYWHPLLSPFSISNVLSTWSLLLNDLNLK